MKFGKITAALLAFAVVLGLSACSRSASITSAADLEGKRIGVREGTTSETWVRENLQRAIVTTYRVAADAAIDLSKGVLDAVVVDELPGREIVAQHKNLEILTSAGSFFREEYGIAVRQGNTELLDAVNAAIQKVKGNGEYYLLYSSFITPEDGNITIPTLNIPAGGGRTLKVGTNSGFPPFEYKDGGEIVGFDMSLAQLIGRECNANIEIVDMVFPALIPALTAGEVDLVMAGMTITEARKRNVDFSEPYFNAEQVILLRK